MVSQDLLNYIRQEKRQGVGKVTLTLSLLKSGWSSADIEDAIALVDKEPSGITFSVGALSADSFYGINPYVFTGPIELVGKALVFYKSRFFSLLLYSFLLLGTLFLPFIISFFLLGANIQQIAQLSSLLQNSSLVGVMGGIFFVSFVLHMWMQLAMIYFIKENESKRSFFHPFLAALPRTIPFFFLLLLGFFIVQGGSLFFLIPGILLSIWLSIAAYVFCGENVGLFTALHLSKTYVSGSWWGVLLRLISLWLDFGVILLILGALLLLSFVNHVFFVGIFSAFVVLLFLIPILYIYNFLLYVNLRFLHGDQVKSFSFLEKTFFLFFLFLGLCTIPLQFFLPVLYQATIGPTVKEYVSTYPVSLDTFIFGQTNPADDLTRKSGRKLIINALEQYSLDNQKIYPIALKDLQPIYLSEMPKDPVTQKEYEYRLGEKKTDYELCITFTSTGRTCVKGNSQQE